MSERNVMFGYVYGRNPSTIQPEFLESVVGLMAAEESQLLASVHGVTCGPLLAMARNLLVRDFLSTDLEWLWTVDTDIVFIPNTLKRLLDVASVHRPVVSALYHTFKNAGKIPAMFLAGDDHEFPPIPENDFELGTLITADAVGAGCLLIHREVLEKIMKDNDGQYCWFRERVAGNRDIGEDLSFCMRVTESGFPIYVHTGIQVAHVKSALLGVIT